MRLHATPLSHFSRKVRLLLDHYGEDYELVDVGNVADVDQSSFANNPLMSVPVLEDGVVWLVESDHIAAYLVSRLDPKDRFDVLSTEVPTLNARAILNGVMSNEVKLILAERTGLAPEGLAYFEKAKSVVAEGLRWCESNSEIFQASKLTYLQCHLVCAMEHLVHYKMIEMNFPRIEEIVSKLGSDPVFKRSAPGAT